uniref:Uncharacterized protein n=1 Tax=Octopus bimaculoides TaxID=37653 RepID=A0A0L8FFI3_OCTBM
MKTLWIGKGLRITGRILTKCKTLTTIPQHKMYMQFLKFSFLKTYKHHFKLPH